MEPSRIAERYEITAPAPGRATFVRNGLFWDVTIESKGQTTYGLAMIVGKRFAIAIGPKDKMEIGAYQISGDRATSLWVPPAAKGDDLKICGREQLVKASDSVWRIEQAVAIDNSSYSGTIEVKPVTPTSDNKPGIVAVTWNLNDGVFASFALRYPDGLLSCWNVGDKAPHGIMGLDGDGTSFVTSTAMHGSDVVTTGAWKRA
jgi:hypothetical protein